MKNYQFIKLKDFFTNSFLKKTIVVKDKQHLQNLIKNEMKKNSLNCDLNHLDVSNIKDMSGLFCASRFNGDISRWITGEVEAMDGMFARSIFNGDISKWDTSKVKNMSAMFQASQFTGDISRWNTAHVQNMSSLFDDCPFNGYIANWDTSNVVNMSEMFRESNFNGDISKWNISKVEIMFEESFLEKNNQTPYWYLPTHEERILVIKALKEQKEIEIDLNVHDEKKTLNKRKL